VGFCTSSKTIIFYSYQKTDGSVQIHQHGVQGLIAMAGKRQAQFMTRVVVE
jgi:hypothetical protein